MITRLVVLSLFIGSFIHAQQISAVYKTDELLNRVKNADTVYVLNFWATWCKPCIQELPAFDSLAVSERSQAVKVILVSLDFKEDADRKVNAFLKKNRISSECVLLDEINGNDYINRFSENWSGSIPATLLIKGSRKKLMEKKMNLGQLSSELRQFQ